MSERYPNRDDECIWPVSDGTCGQWGSVAVDFHTHDEGCEHEDPDHEPDAACHPLTLPEPE